MDVQYFVMDMNLVYHDLVLHYFPTTKIVTDKFHVMQYVTLVLENVRKQIQTNLHPQERRYFKRSLNYFLLSKVN